MTGIKKLSRDVASRADRKTAAIAELLCDHIPDADDAYEVACKAMDIALGPDPAIPGRYPLIHCTCFGDAFDPRCPRHGGAG